MKPFEQKEYRKNDIVSCNKHDRLMVVEFYRTMQDGSQKIVVTEGGYYSESELVKLEVIKC